jgi:hypothetical protein
MSGPVEIVLIVAAVCYLLVRRLMGEPAQAKRMLILPAVLTVIGVTQLSGQVSSPTALVFLVGSAAISVVLGALRGMSVRISERDGVAFIRYTGVTIALWAANIAVKLGANFALGAIDPKAGGAASAGLLFTLGVGILAEGLVVLVRALRNDHSVVWSPERDRTQRRTSPLDNLQRTLNSHDDTMPSRWDTRPARHHRR